MLRTSTAEENVPTNSFDSVDEDSVYMNETFRNNIPLEKLHSVVAEQGTTEYDQFKKEYAVIFFLLIQMHTCN